MTPLFLLEGVGFAYHPGDWILRGLDLAFEPGERVGITGKNGAGKTTLLYVMAGLLHPAEGRISAFGKACRCEADYHAVRRRAQLVFEDPDDQMICATVAEDVAFGPLQLGWPRERIRAAVEAALACMDLADAGPRLTWQLSRGEKKRVALAGALAMEPAVLLLDEPTAGLDAAHSDRLASRLTEPGTGFLSVSHDEAFLARVCTRRLRLEDRRLIPAG